MGGTSIGTEFFGDFASQALQVIGFVDAILLLLPLCVLNGLSSRSNGTLWSPACGFSIESLSSLAIIAVCCLCFSLLIVGAQLVILGVSSLFTLTSTSEAKGRRHAFMKRLLRDLPLPLITTAAGGFLGAYVLWGQTVMYSGSCQPGLPIILVITFAGAYLLALYYTVLSRYVHPAAGPSGKEEQISIIPTEGAGPVLVPRQPAVQDENLHANVHQTIPVGVYGDNHHPPKPPAGGCVSPFAVAIKGLPSSATCSTRASKNGSAATEMPSIKSWNFARKSPSPGSPKMDEAEIEDLPTLPGYYEDGQGEEGDTAKTVADAPESNSKRYSEVSNASSFWDSCDGADIVPEPPEPYQMIVGKSCGNTAPAATPRLSVASELPRALTPALKRASSGSRRGSVESKKDQSRRGSMESSASSVWDGSCSVADVTMTPPESPEIPEDHAPQQPRRRSSSSRHSTGVLGKLASPVEPDRKKASKTENRFERVFFQRRSTLNDAMKALENTDVNDDTEKADQKVLALKQAVGTATRNENPETGSTSDDTPANNGVGARYSIMISDVSDMTGRSQKSVSIKLSSDDLEAANTPADGEESHAMMLDMPVLHYMQSPINFDHLGAIKGREVESDSEADSGEANCEENWDSPLEPQVEVPVWLLDKMKSGEGTTDAGETTDVSDAQNTLDSETPETSPEQRRGTSLEEECESEEGEDLDQVAELVDVFKTGPLESTSDSAARKRISFSDQVTGTSFEKYSSLKTKSSPTAKRANTVDADNVTMKFRTRSSQMHQLNTNEEKKKVALAVRSKSDSNALNGGATPGTFWKIPMPTRKNTMMPQQQQITAHEEEETRDQITPVNLLRKQSVKLPGKEIGRRPSVLGVFSNDGAKAAGLYALPNEGGEGKQECGEVVEVKRKSIVMSPRIMNDILKAKVDDDRYEDICKDLEDGGNVSAEIVLPFFSATRSAFRQCQCKVDADTGIVLHTCMTPAATQCDNTQAFQSFVCSAWCSRRGSRKSSDGDSSDEELGKGRPDEAESELGDDVGALVKIGTDQARTGKRIRNASMLAIVSAPPAPAKQNTDMPLSKSKDKKDDDKNEEKKNEDSSDEERPEENELSVSFRHIAEEPDAAPQNTDSEKVSAQNASGSIPKALDEQVESDLGHRFELVEPWQLAQMLRNREVREQILTVDVRGRDWVGGHIPSSINLHTSEVVRHPESLVMQCLRNRIHHLIFTCMYSVLRARKSALAIEQAQQDAQKAGLQTYRIRISLLAGGMHAWVNRFILIQPQKSLVQDWDEDCWIDGGPSQGGLVHVMDALWSQGGQKALSDALTAELSTLLATRGRESRDGSRRCSAEVANTT